MKTEANSAADNSFLLISQPQVIPEECWAIPDDVYRVILLENSSNFTSIDAEWMLSLVSLDFVEFLGESITLSKQHINLGSFLRSHTHTQKEMGGGGEG